jgi:threonine dehydratase
MLTLKLELHQHAGSFKTRGAFAHLRARVLPEAGVVAASGGNHGAAVAYAARQRGVKATIFVPAISSPAKIARIRDFAAELVIEGGSYADTFEKSLVWRKHSGALMIPAFDQHETLLGQATVGLEIEEQAPGLDTLLVAVGGGGLIGGIAAWYGGRLKMIAVEPEASPTLARALETWRAVDAPVGGLAADSLTPRQVDGLGFAIAQRFVERVILVADQDIRAAQNALWRGARVAAEPAERPRLWPF